MAAPKTADPVAVDVLVSTFNEEEFIDECLDHVLAQTIEKEYRVWLVDGGSTDATVEIVSARAATDSRLNVIADGVRRNLPEALNMALPLGNAPLVAKIDAHGYPDRDFLERAVAAFERSDSRVGCVGGRPVQLGSTTFGKAVAAARGSRFGVGASEYAGTDALAEVDTVQCGIYLRSALESVGGFDARMNFGEDEELNWRLRRAGYTILIDTAIGFRYYARSTWRSAFRQYRNYGRARVRVIRAHPEFVRLHHVVPMIAVLGVLILALAALQSTLAAEALVAVVAVYTGSALIFAKKASRPDADPVRIAAAFTALHIGYGSGMLDEVIRTVAARARSVLLRLGRDVFGRE